VIFDWQLTTSYPHAVRWIGAAASATHIYCVGGNDSTTYATGSTLVYYGKILPTGGIQSWIATTSQSAPIYGTAVIVANGYLWTLGGAINGLQSNKIQRAPINGDGSIGAWADSNTTLLGVRGIVGAAYYNGYYYMAGNGLSATSVTYYGQLNSDGTSTCSAGTTTPANLRYTDGSIVIKDDYMYVLNLYNSTSGPFYAPINGDHSIGTWSNAGQNGQWGNHSGAIGIIADGNAYCVGNYVTDYTKFISFPMSNPTTFGSPSSPISLPDNWNAGAGLYTQGRAYMIGGTQTIAPAGFSARVYVSSLSPPGSSIFTKINAGFNSGVNF
jgi:hypothetical protein